MQKLISPHRMAALSVLGAMALLLLGYLAIAPAPLMAASAQATVWEVDRLDDPALPAGTACTGAADDCTLRGAIDQAVDGDTVQLTVPGTITLTQATLILTKSITITSPGQAEHIIDGGDSHRLFTINGERHVILDQLTLQNGRAGMGGAVNIAAGTLTMTHVLLQNNTSNQTGGALYASPASEGTLNLYLAQVDFRNNHARDTFQSGGAIHTQARQNSTVNLTIVDGHFESNLGGPTQGSGGYGGAISATTLDANSRMTLDIRGSRFISNTTGDYGGALYVQPYNRTFGAQSSIDVSIHDSEFAHNIVESEFSGIGGGVYLSALDSGSTLDFVIHNSEFVGNRAHYEGGGLAIASYNRDGSGENAVRGEIAGSVFQLNSADRGGGLHQRALDNASATAITISTTTFMSNTALQGGGGIYLAALNRDSGDTEQAHNQLVVEQSTFADNRAVDSDGGALYVQAAGSSAAGISEVALTNVTFSGNQSAQDGGALYASASGITATTATLDIVNVTAFDNSAPEGNDFFVREVGFAGAHLDLISSIIAGGQGTPCAVVDAQVTGANNRIDDISCGEGAPFRLGAVSGLVPNLADNGGPTLTHHFYAGSNALDAVPAGQCTEAGGESLLVVDQRGELRPFGAACDVGALEAQTTELPDAPEPDDPNPDDPNPDDPNPDDPDPDDPNPDQPNP
ncbi:MAG: choice-of-anchor Q domain-containing protein, partial [Litorilinea sp.]